MKAHARILAAVNSALTRSIIGCVLLFGFLTVPALSAPPPQISSITPNSSSNDTAALAAIISGSNFASGASALLTEAGQADIVGTSVDITDSGATNLTATFNLVGAVVGAWNVVVINSDGQSNTLSDAFTVLPSAPPPEVLSIAPASVTNNVTALATVISGSNFASGASALLTQAGQADIVGTNVTVTDSGATNLAATFNLDNVVTGAWNVVVIDADGQSSALSNGFTVLAVPPVETFQISTSPSPPGGGTTAGDGTYTNGTTAMVTATANACFAFVNWVDQNSNVVSTTASYSFTVDTDEVLVANFAPMSYTVDTTNSPSGGGVTSGGGTVACGSNVTVCASPNSCYSFVNWTDENSNVLSTSACYTFVPVTNQVLIASFLLNTYSIVASSSPSGGGSTSGGGTYPCGTNLTMVATANDCFSFVNWTDQNSNVVSTSPSYSFAIDTDQVLVANFAAVSYTIDTSSSPSGGGSISGGGTVACGSNVTVCASPSSCYSFMNWTDESSNVLSSAACYTFTAASNETLVANFAPVTVPTNGSLTTLWMFPGGSDGASPEGPLVQGSDGNFYGTTVYGGPGGSGTVFRITPDGTLTNLHLFVGSDGAYPSAGLVEGNDGNFYGTTANGGASGYGTVFRISPDGTLTTLVSFTNGLDGGYPYTALIQASDGNFYGTTYEGGLTGGGTVFRMTPSGSLSNLWSFTGGSGGGIYPFAGLVQGDDGDFYGTATYDGANNAGLVFRIDASGNLTNLHSFGDSEGSYPYGGLTAGSDGNFYGTTYQGGANGYGSVYRVSPGGDLTNLWSFTNGADGANSFARLVLGSDGNFYGTTFGSGSGPSAHGTVFQITPAGSLSNLWEFTGCDDGGNSYAGLVQGNDGNFYGASYGTGSGSSASGTVFRINTGLCAHGVNTSSAPLAGGSTSGGGIYSCGSNVTVCASPNACYSFVNWTDQNSDVVSTSACYAFVPVTNQVLTANFSLNTYTIVASSSPSGGGSAGGGGTYPCGTNLTVVATANDCFSFVNWTDENSNVVSTSPSYPITVSTNRTLVANFAAVSYAIDVSSVPSAGGFTSGGGTVPCGTNVMVCATANPCYSFVNWTDQNSNVVSASTCVTFVASSNRMLVANFAPISYTITVTNLLAAAGSVTGGGTVACGSNVTVCASPNSCYNFVNWTDQDSNVVSDSACFTFTAAANEALVANFALVSAGIQGNGSLTNLWSFTGGLDGANPLAGLVQGSDGNFYGTAYDGGAHGYGTVFRIGPSGNLTNLWSFGSGTDGANPGAGLVRGRDGNFYGTTYGAGSGPSANGNVFRISPAGSLTNLWSFTGGLDGASPFAGLVQGSDGNFYGMTSGGGPSGDGTVFRISASGTLTNLHSFNGSDGANPSAGLVQGGDGNFYGTTPSGGANGYGTVFQITPSGVLTTLWSFANGVDGANSYAPLVPGVDGNFYGTTAGSGSGPSGYGTVFRISPSGSLTTLWSFIGCSDGAYPFAGLVQGSDGNFYGTTYGSGSGPAASGTVFWISPVGTLTTLWSFTNGVDGADSYGPLVQGLDGSFYGTTSGSGSGPSGNGSVFKLSIPLNPPANQVLAIQVGGSNVVLTLPSVAGETYQLQFSNSMNPTNWANIMGASITNSIGGPLSLTNFGGALQPQGFYRFDITP